MKTFPHHYSSTTSLDCWHRALWCRCEFLTLPSASLCRLCFSVLRFLVSLCQLPLHISIYVRSRCCSSPASRLDVCELWDPFCAHNSHKDLLSELPQPFCQLQPVWPFSFDLSSTRHFLQQNYCSLDVTFFFVVVSYFSHNSEQRLLYLEIQGEEQYSSTSGANNIIIIKVIDVQFVPLSDVSCEH